MTDPIIERAARALYEDWMQERDVAEEATRNGPHPAWADISGQTKVFWLQKARAVLRAIREPSHDMVYYGCCNGPPADCRSIWENMIDAALGKGE